ncbi:MAG: 30S ribosomal protein S12 methylthiotransferase RimO [Gammaproteobacteria bacterium]|nr:30S ribosomal protein S12 methylthiotransferase RimO [Gammaproteobacteria bacterium]MDH5802608.1 30S ribosomal protein S12 methylthiotransferase RimO [Gammaproteobacteria bacterium]
MNSSDPNSESKKTNQAPKVGFISLGCPKALVDSEHILTQLRAEGYAISTDYDEAQLVVVNTCGFIDSAVEESLEAIGEALDENGKVIVTGCLGARDSLVQDRYPNVLAVTGPHATAEVMQAIHRHLPKPHDPFMDLVPQSGIKLTPKHYAYLKISEGCNHTCTFCIIPDLRGPLASRPVDKVLQEAHHLVQAGTKELLVVSQDTSAYGLDIKHKTQFWNNQAFKTHMTDLAKGLSQLGVWVRFHYVYPYPHVEELIPLMAEGKILPYLDMPLQHASPNVLKAMKRPGKIDRTLDRIQTWRKHCPELTLRSTFIVGFPGETEQDFQMLLDFLQEAQLDRVGAFAYSPVAGAKANALPNPVPETLQQERLQHFMEAQAQISADKLRQKIGQRMTVLVDGLSEDHLLLARTTADAPEIDGVVILDGADTAQAGDFLEVEISGATEHDLIGVPLNSE